MRTIPNIAAQLEPLEQAIRTQLIPALTEGQHVSEYERQLLALPVRYGGLGLINPCTISDIEFYNSLNLTAELTSAITGQVETVNRDDIRKEVSVNREQ